MEEKPYTVREEKVRLGCYDYKFQQALRIFEISFQIERTELWNKKLQIISEHTVKVGVNPAFLQVSYRSRLMRIHPHHGLGNLECLVPPAQPALDVKPLLKPLDESLLGDGLGLLAADAATEQIVKAAACSKETTGLRIIVLVGHDVL